MGVLNLIHCQWHWALHWRHVSLASRNVNFRTVSLVGLGLQVEVHVHVTRGRATGTGSGWLRVVSQRAAARAQLLVVVLVGRNLKSLALASFCHRSAVAS